MKVIPIFLFFCSGLVHGVSNAQTTGDYRTAQSNVTWSNSSHWQTWNGSQWVTASNAPGSNNDIYVQAGHSVTLNSSQSCNSIFISSGTSSATTGGDGQIILQDKILSCYGKLCCYFGVVNTVNGSGTTLSFTLTTTTPSAPITKSTGGVLKFVGNSRTVTANNEWGANATGSNALFDVEFALNKGEIATIGSVIKAANWLVSSGTLNSLVRIAVDNGTTGQGNLTILNGATLISGETGSGATPVIARTTLTICGTITINGLLKLTGISPHIQCNSIVTGNTAIIEYARTGSQNFLASSFTGAATLINYPNLILSGSGNKTTLASLTTSLNSRGSLFMAGGTLSVGTSATFSASNDSTTLIYMASSAQTATSTEWDTAFNHLVINNAAGVSLNFTRRIKGKLVLKQGVFYNGANLEMAGNSSIIKQNGNLASVPMYLGSLNVFYLQASKLISTGLEIPSDSTLLSNLEVDNSFGVRLKKRITVNGVLSLKNGLVLNTDSFPLIIGPMGGSSVGSDSSFVNGKMIKLGNTDFVFPIGRDSIWAAAGICKLSGSKKIAYSASYFSQPPPNQSALGAGLSKGIISNLEYWIITPDSASKGSIKLFWKNGKRSGISSLGPTDLVVSGYSGSHWVNDSNALVSGNTNSGNVESRVRSVWGLSTFGSPSKANPLPVKLLYFRSQNGVLKGNALEWATVTELNSKGFEIEKAYSNGKFSQIGFVASASKSGNSSQKLYYSFVDSSQMPRQSFYRLRQVDYNGDFAYSNIVKCSPKLSKPVDWEFRGNEVFILNPGKVSAYFRLYNLKGEILVEKDVFLGESFYVGTGQPGIYYLQMDDQVPVKCYLD